MFMVSSGLTRAEVLDPDNAVAFPSSVEQFFHGDLGQPHGGFPPALQAKVLKGRAPLTTRPGEALPPADLAALRVSAQPGVWPTPTDRQFASYLLYPQGYSE